MPHHTTPSIGKRLLIAEDHPINARLLSLMLERLGFQVEHVLDGAAAIEAIQKDSSLEAILMDMRMPGMDGLEATRSIRAGAAGEARRDIMIIGVTANALHADRNACLAAGMNFYLSKPINPSVLLSVLQEAHLLEAVAHA